MRDAALDPASGDYTGASLNDLGNAVYVRLMTPLGSYWADPALGSRLHELQRQKDLSRVRVLAVQYAQSALAPLLADKRAQRINVAAVDAPKGQDGAGRMLLTVEVTDAGGRKKTFNHFVKVS